MSTIGIDVWLAGSQQQLQEAGISSARLDAVILLEDELAQDRAHLLAHPDMQLSSAQVGRLHTKITRRLQHEPLAYIRGTAPFYGRDFMVNQHVLVPRPETESMIELLVKLPLPTAPRVADVGTGSGCLAVTAALELPGARVYAYDIDDGALQVAAGNAARLQATVTCTNSDLLAAADWPLDVVLANLPYVPDQFPINAAARHEPALALFAGADGLDLYRRFWQQIHEAGTANAAGQPKFVLTESLMVQHAAVAKLAVAAGYTLAAARGLIQQFVRR